jgi:catechol 2,3-dioxygenase
VRRDLSLQVSEPLNPFRLPSGTRIGRVVLQIGDLERSLGFYQQVIGFRLLTRDNAPGRGQATLGAPDSDRVLLELREKPGVHPIPYRGRLGIYHFATLLPSRADLGRFLGHVASLGVRIGSAEHRVSEALYLVDSDGISIEVYRDRPPEEWPRRDGEVLAPSDPLDVDGLLAAGGSAAWQGVPRGTTVGHMHFYVGDLPAAEAFYHKALGFDRTMWSVPRMLFVAAGGYHHHVGLNTFAADTPVAAADDAKLLYWELRLPDAATVTATADNVRQAGYRVTEADDHVLAQDPWSIVVRLTHD